MKRGLVLLILTLGLASATFGDQVGSVTGCIDPRIGPYGKPVLGPHRGPILKPPVVRWQLWTFPLRKAL